MIAWLSSLLTRCRTSSTVRLGKFGFNRSASRRLALGDASQIFRLRFRTRRLTRQQARLSDRMTHDCRRLRAIRFKTGFLTRDQEIRRSRRLLFKNLGLTAV